MVGRDKRCPAIFLASAKDCRMFGTIARKTETGIDLAHALTYVQGYRRQSLRRKRAKFFTSVLRSLEQRISKKRLRLPFDLLAEFRNCAR
jgi:hypothetical protein